MKNKIKNKFGILIMLIFSTSFVSAQPPAPTAQSCYDTWRTSMTIINNTSYNGDCDAMLQYEPEVSNPPTVEEFIAFTIWYEDWSNCESLAEYRYFQDVHAISEAYDECMELVPDPDEED